jgi:nitrite reductase/ring-hydroxylating ferredoxin subunit
MFDDQPREAPSSEEVSRALRRCWQPVARVEDLAHGPQRAILLGEALAVFLSESGKAAVVADRCAHRGASLSMGKVTGDSIQCPYHGWEWGGRDGACTRVPSLPDQSQIPPLARIPAFPAREHWGLVWTVLEEPLGELPTMPWFDEEEWTWGHGTPFELPVSFGLMIENFRDVGHLAFVHQDTLGAIPEVIEPLRVERDDFRVTLRRKMLAGDGADAIWGSLRELHTHAIAPNFTSAQMLMVKGERCLLHAARAIGPAASAHYWIVGFAKDYDEFNVEEAIEFEQRLYGEDCAIVSAVEPPELALDPNAEVNTLADRFTLAYRQAFGDYVDRALSRRIPG